MNYDDLKLQTPTEGSEGLYDEHYRDLIEEYEENECTLIELIVDCKDSIRKVRDSESIAYTTAGGYFERQKDLLRLERRLHKLNAMHFYIIQKIETYENYLNENN